MSPFPDRMVVDRMRGDPALAVGERTTAAAPSVNDEHISRVRGGTIGGDASTSSTVTALWNWALGLRAPCLRALAAAAAICSTVAPRSSIRSTAHAALSAIRTLPAGSRAPGACGSDRPGARRPRCRPWSRPRSPVHIFSTPTASTVPVPARLARVARCSAEEPPAQELSTLTMPAFRRPARPRNVWPRMQPWSSRRPAVALPSTTRLTSAASIWALARASATTWWAISVADWSLRCMGEMPVPTMCAVASTVTFSILRALEWLRRPPAGRRPGARTGPWVGRR